MHSDLQNLKGITIDPYNINSLCQLPGIDSLISPMKELNRKISTMSISASNQIKNDNDVLDLVNLLPWNAISLNSHR